jgi:hypothetical protein
MKLSQVEIKTANLDTDKKIVEGIFLAATVKFNLFDNTETSKVPDTIKSIVERKGFGFGLGARVVGNSIFVDFNRMKGDSQKFEQVHQFISEELKRTFQCDLLEVWEGNPAYCKTS